MSAVFPFPAQPVTARQQLREAVVAALKAAALTVGESVVSVDSPGDWPYPQDKLPAVCVRSPSDNKASTGKRQTNFTTTVEVDVRAAVAATTAEAAQALIDLLWFQVERAILLDYYTLELVQNVASVETSVEIKANGQVHLAGAIGRFRFETFETFDIGAPIGTAAAPSVAPRIVPLAEVTIDITQADADPPWSAQPGDLGLRITALVDASSTTVTSDTSDVTSDAN